jgi:hypothetical protein
MTPGRSCPHPWMHLMNSMTYAQAMDGALDRLQTTGF